MEPNEEGLGMARVVASQAKRRALKEAILQELKGADDGDVRAVELVHRVSPLHDTEVPLVVSAMWELVNDRQAVYTSDAHLRLPSTSAAHA